MQRGAATESDHGRGRDSKMNHLDHEAEEDQVHQVKLPPMYELTVLDSVRVEDFNYSMRSRNSVVMVHFGTVPVCNMPSGASRKGDQAIFPLVEIL